MRLNDLKSRRSIVKSLIHSEDCDDYYQEQLEIKWEISDLQDNIRQLTSEANSVVEWFSKMD